MQRSGTGDNEDGDCRTAGVVDTTFNEAPNSYLFSGIMFSVRTKHTPITIETMEFDIDTDRGAFGSVPNLDVEIFTHKGQYNGIMSNPSEWTLVAKTTAVRINSRPGALVPVNDFDGVEMAANEFRSFYISMTGKYLDNRANGLDKSGEIDQEFGDVLTLFTGTGLQTKFPDAPDRTVAPKFTGRIHYTEESACGSTAISVVTSVIDLQLDIETTNVDDTIRLADEVLESYLQEQLSGGVLSTFSTKYSLERVGDIYTTGFSRAGVCRFDPCTRIKSGLTFQHLSWLNFDSLEVTILEDVSTIVAKLRTTLGLRVVNSGPRTSTATFDVLVGGIPANKKMNAEQTTYFESIARAFIDATPLKIYHFNVTDQMLLGPNTLQVSGEIYGTSSFQEQDEFASTIQKVLIEGENAFIDELKLQLLLTPRLQAQDSMFFSELTKAEATVHTVVVNTYIPSVSPTPVPIIGDDPVQGGLNVVKERAQNASKDTLMIVGAIAAGCLVVIGMLWRFCHIRSLGRLRYKNSEKSDAEPILPSSNDKKPIRGRSASTASIKSESPPVSPNRMNAGSGRHHSSIRGHNSSASLDFNTLWSSNDNGEMPPSQAESSSSQSQHVMNSSNAPGKPNSTLSKDRFHRSISFDSNNRPQHDLAGGNDKVARPSISYQSFRSPSKHAVSSNNEIMRRCSGDSFRSQSHRQVRSVELLQPPTPNVASTQSFRSPSKHTMRPNDYIVRRSSGDSFRSQSHRQAPSVNLDQSFRSPAKHTVRSNNETMQKYTEDSFRSQSERMARSNAQAPAGSSNQSSINSSPSKRLIKSNEFLSSSSENTIRSKSQRMAQSNENQQGSLGSKDSFLSQSQRSTSDSLEPNLRSQSQRLERSHGAPFSAKCSNTSFRSQSQRTTRSDMMQNCGNAAAESSNQEAIAVSQSFRSPIKVKSQAIAKSSRTTSGSARPSPIFRSSSDDCARPPPTLTLPVRTQSSTGHVSPQQHQRFVQASPRRENVGEIGKSLRSKSIENLKTPATPQRGGMLPFDSLENSKLQATPHGASSQRTLSNNFVRNQMTLASPRRGNLQSVSSKTLVSPRRGNVQRMNSVGSQSSVGNLQSMSSKRPVSPRRGHVQHMNSVGSQRVSSPVSPRRGNLQRMNSVGSQSSVGNLQSMSSKRPVSPRRGNVQHMNSVGSQRVSSKTPVSPRRGNLQRMNSVGSQSSVNSMYGARNGADQRQPLTGDVSRTPSFRSPKRQPFASQSKSLRSQTGVQMRRDFPRPTSFNEGPV